MKRCKRRLNSYEHAMKSITHAYATRNNIIMNWKFSFVRLCLHIIQYTHAFTPCQTRKQKSPLNHEHHFTENYRTQFNVVVVGFFSFASCCLLILWYLCVLLSCARAHIFECNLNAFCLMISIKLLWFDFFFRFTLILPFLFAVWVLSVCRFTYV